MQSRIKGGLFQGVDFLAVLYYLLLVAAGCICITAASFDEETADFFAFSHFYIKQYMWVTAVLVVALVVLLLDVRYYHMWAYQRRQVMDRTGVAAHPARRVRQDRHGAGAGARDEQLFLLDQPLRRSAARGCDRRHPDAAHHSAKRHRFGHRAGCIPLRPLPRRTQQVALHPDSAHRCALHRFVPADAHDAAGAADPDLRGVGGDDERPMAFAHRLPRLAGALGHRPLVVHGTHRCSNRTSRSAS